MEVSEVKKEIAKLRDQLLDTLTKFEEKTEVQVHNIYISRIDLSTADKPKYSSKIADIDLETIIRP